MCSNDSNRNNVNSNSTTNKENKDRAWTHSLII